MGEWEEIFGEGVDAETVIDEIDRANRRYEREEERNRQEALAENARGRSPDIHGARTFSSFREALAWAKANPGQAITRIPGSEGFMVKPSRGLPSSVPRTTRPERELVGASENPFVSPKSNFLGSLPAPKNLSFDHEIQPDANRTASVQASSEPGATSPAPSSSSSKGSAHSTAGEPLVLDLRKSDRELFEALSTKFIARLVPFEEQKPKEQKLKKRKAKKQERPRSSVVFKASTERRQESSPSPIAALLDQRSEPSTRAVLEDALQQEGRDIRSVLPPVGAATPECGISLVVTQT